MANNCTQLGREHVRPNDARTFIRTNEYYFPEIESATNPATQQRERLFEIYNRIMFYDCICTICGGVIKSAPTGEYEAISQSPMFHSDAQRLKHGVLKQLV